MPFVEHQGEMRELLPGEVVVGSGTQAAWRVQNADLASRHLAFQVEAQGVRVRALSAQHLVVVNGEAIGGEPRALASGDVGAAGGTRFLVLDRVDAPRPERWASEPSAAWLVDDARPAAWALDRRAVTIGRDAASHVQLRDSATSRFHADVRREAGQFVLYSMGATGTQVNDQPLARPRLLAEGDRVAIGGTSLRFTHQLPSGVPLVRGGDGEEDSLAREQTQVKERADVTRAPRRTALLATAGVAVLAVTALAYLLLR